MRKIFINKTAFCLLITTIMACLHACEQDEYIFTPTNHCVSFEGNEATFSLDGRPVELQILRGVATEALTLTVSLDPGSVYTLATPQLQFAAGELAKTVQLTYSQENLVPAVEYPFTVRFDEAEKSPAGKSSFTGNGLMPLNYIDYGIVEYTGMLTRYSTKPEQTRMKLQIGQYTKTYYRIKDCLNSGIDLDFTLTADGTLSITAPKGMDNPYYSSPMFSFPTSIVYTNGENITAWFDTDPTCWYLDNGYGTDYTMVTGTTIGFDALFTTPTGKEIYRAPNKRWWFDTLFKVVSVSYQP